MKLFLSDLRSHSEHFPALPYVAWSSCGYRNGPYGALVDAVLLSDKEEHLAGLLEILSASSGLHKEAILSGLHRTDPKTQTILRRLVAQERFRAIRKEVSPTIATSSMSTNGYPTKN